VPKKRQFAVQYFFEKPRQHYGVACVFRLVQTQNILLASPLDQNVALILSVIQKHVLVDDRFAEHEIILNRHANGEDWWMISTLRNSNEYAVYLIDSTGVMMTSIQAIGITDDRWSRGGGQSVFGSLGQKLVRWNTVSGLQLFDFDRETGMLSNSEFYPSPLMGGRDFLSGGVGVSPSGQYAYVSTVLDVYQYDLWAEDIGVSQLHIAEIGNPDSLWIGVAPTAFNFQLGPDCKLYSYTNTGLENHIIHQPYERGDACEWDSSGWSRPDGESSLSLCLSLYTLSVVFKKFYNK
jgi:hypothetical protein